VHDGRLVALKCRPAASLSGQRAVDDGLNTLSVVFRCQTCDPG
jgi:hypothetical protein